MKCTSIIGHFIYCRPLFSAAPIIHYSKPAAVTERIVPDTGDTDGRQVSNKVNDLMMNRFKEKCGSYICNDLLGCDVSTEEGVQYCRDNKLFTEFCPKMVAAAVEVVEEIIQEQKKA